MPSRMALLRSLTAFRHHMSHRFSFGDPFFTITFLRFLRHGFPLRELKRLIFNTECGSIHHVWSVLGSEQSKVVHHQSSGMGRLVGDLDGWLRQMINTNATLWVLETCPIVGRLPMMIIVITASLSSKMHNIAPSWEEFTFEETKWTFDNSRCLWETCVIVSSLASRMLYHAKGCPVRAWLSAFDLSKNASHQ